MVVSRKVGQAWQRLLREAQRPQGRSGGKMQVLVGVPRTAGGEDGVTYAQLAQWLHDGTSTIPPHPFLSVPLQKPEMLALVQRVAAKILDGGDPYTLLSLLGQHAVNQVIAYINAGVPPPNAQSTIDRKGSSLPLVDTGVLKSKITYVLKGVPKPKSTKKRKKKKSKLLKKLKRQQKRALKSLKRQQRRTTKSLKRQQKALKRSSKRATKATRRQVRRSVRALRRRLK